MKLLKYINSHKVATIILTFILVAGIGVRVWLHYDKSDPAIVDGFAHQQNIVKSQAEEALKIEQNRVEDEEPIQEVEREQIREEEEIKSNKHI